MEARYLPTGHLVYTLPNNNNLYAVAFDLDKLEVKGGPVPIVEGVEQAAVSDAGTLVYIPGTALQTTSAGPLARTLVWVDRQGKEESIHMPPDYYLFPSISPDGKRVALTKRAVGDTVGQHIWIWDLVRETLTPLTTGKSSNNYKPIWTRDGKRIVFPSRRDGKFGIYWKASDGTGEDQVLVLSPAKLTMLTPWSWSSDGKTLAMGTLDLAANPAHGDIATLSMEGDPIIKILLQAEYNQVHPTISPDGKYIAYMSGETGNMELYVRPFPEVNKGKWPISTGGGESPIWSPDSSELFYRNEAAVMAVSIDTKATFSAGKPRMLFQGPYVTGYEDSPAWDISPDGKKFLMIKQPSPTDKPDSAAGPRKINIVLNWLEELKQRVPVD
jgi:serine/threonine-protein kinase